MHINLDEILSIIDKNPAIKEINFFRQNEFLKNQELKTDFKIKILYNENPSKYIGKEREYLEKVLKSENWSSTSGNWTSSLEHQFARKF